MQTRRKKIGEIFITNNEHTPSLDKGSFTCTRCKVYTPHKHFQIVRLKRGEDQDIPHIGVTLHDYKRGSGIKSVNFQNFYADGVDENWNSHISVCSHCLQYTIWESEKIIFPVELDTPTPSLDMPKDVKKIYEEAQSVYEHSPRASSALLRLAIETLIPQLEFGVNKTQSLFKMIGELVDKEIPTHIQEGLDAIRYYGNNGIHTAEIDMKDDRNSVIFLFNLCNLIVKELITEKKEIKEFYNLIPEKLRSSIDKRDKKIQHDD